ncbi:hypothetical protein MIND_00707600 [Mycena indigotica]|uniref:Uncharacterized protein n=1 Tax=Mycena indigotica TaxID=2126181 RepID=A0A8H6SKR8_9AGAR|nr:uncharacterized protein MIND_00707600 [Mycena indigotica]KAF7301423.1 hypothetical protein MIND_00707600 [Mycena indigotica]
MANTTTLPSFVELMASLGLDQAQDRSPSSSPSSSPRATPPSPSKSRSNPSLRDSAASRNRLARYNPYSPKLSERRGSLSSLSSSSSSDYERPIVRAYSTSPHPPSSPRARRRHGNKLTVNVFGSNSDLAANTPISSYVRRKTPGASPTSPTFPREALDYSPSSSPMPFSIPTLPTLFPRSASSESFPLTPNSDISSTNNSPNPVTKPLPDEERLYFHRTYHTGVRISSPPMSEGRFPRAQS